MNFQEALKYKLDLHLTNNKIEKHGMTLNVLVAPSSSDGFKNYLNAYYGNPEVFMDAMATVYATDGTFTVMGFYEQNDIIFYLDLTN